MNPDNVLHPVERQRRVQRAQRSKHCRLESDVLRLRIALGAIAAAHDRRARESNEDRLCEVRMPHHELTLFERCELRFHRWTEHRISGRRQLVRVHAAVERRAGVPDDASVHLRAKLLRAEEHQAQVSPALGEVEKHLADVCVLSVTRCVLVELVHEHDDVLHTEVSLLEMLAQLRDDAREDQILRVFLERGDVDDIHRAVLKAPEWQITNAAVVGDEARTARGDVREAVAHLANRRDVVRAPALVPALLHGDEHVAEPSLQVGERPHAIALAREYLLVSKIAVDDTLSYEVNERTRLRVDVVLVQEHFRVLQHLAQAPRQRRHVMQQRLVGA